MKFNPDCIRDVMLTLEEELTISEETDNMFRFQAMSPNRLALLVESRNGRTREDVVYSLLQLIESRYVVTTAEYPLYGHFELVELGKILYITPKGHEFITSVQDKETWSKKISPILKKMGGASLAVIEAVAKGFANAMLDKIDFSSLPASESP